MQIKPVREECRTQFLSYSNRFLYTVVFSPGQNFMIYLYQSLRNRQSWCGCENNFKINHRIGV